MNVRLFSFHNWRHSLLDDFFNAGNWSRSHKAGSVHLSGDVGARRILAAHPEAVVPVEVASDGIFEDVDTRAAYDRLHADDPNG